MQHTGEKHLSIKIGDTQGIYREENMKHDGKILYRRKTRRILNRQIEIALKEIA